MKPLIELPRFVIVAFPPNPITTAVSMALFPPEMSEEK
jgi:hypothetical protein